MPWRLLVIDGADTRRFFPLPDSGTVVVGNSHKHADICLNDLVMARIHCEVAVENDVVTVNALSDDRETRIQGQKIASGVLHPGEVLRVGNTQLRLEADDGQKPKDDEDDDVEVLEEATKEPPQVAWKEMERLSGHRIGHFDVLRVIGRGHTAVTFRAHDAENKREVALKVVGPAFSAAPEELQHFARVIRKVAAISEEHLVTWYSAGRSNKYVWIAQELIEGESLKNMLERGQTASMMLKWRNALKLAIDLAKALAAIQRRRIVHGNLTPANIMIGMDRTTKLNDLMYEEALRGSKWHEERLEKKLLAELPYMAPERLEDGAYWDKAADMYSLGAITYARLTSRPPFEGRTPGELIEAIREGHPTKPRDIVRGCPEKFQAIVLKMLAHNQEDRYSSPDLLVQELEGLQTLA